MIINLSKSLLFGLLISLIVSIVLLLEPELPRQKDQIIIDGMTTRLERNDEIKKQSFHELHTTNIWIRMMESEPVLEKNVIAQESIQLHAPKIEVEHDSQPIVMVEPQQPNAPTPQYAYVGRLIDDNNESLFLLSPSGPLVVKRGEILQGEWQVMQATETSLDLRYLPLNTTYRLMSK